MRALKWTAICIGALFALVAVVLVGARVVSTGRLAKTWDVHAFAAPVLPEDEAAIMEGGRLFAARGCADCHAADAGGRIVIDDPVLGQLHGANLTGGQGGLPASFTDADFVRALHHCVRPDGTSIKLMPCDETVLVPDREIAAMRAWLKRQPPIDRASPGVQLGPIGHALHAFGVVPLVGPEKVDFDAKPPPAPEAGPTAAWGERLVQIQCIGCHGSGLSGGPMPGMPPSVPIPTNITPESATGIGSWNREQFAQLLKTGKRPDGSDVNPFMPWSAYRHLNETELEAIWTYLRAVPEKPFGSR